MSHWRHLGDLVRTVGGGCYNQTCVQLAHISFEKQFNVKVLLGILILIGVAILSFLLTFKFRQKTLFANLTHTLVATTDTSVTSNAKDVKPNPFYIKLNNDSDLGANHYYMTIDSQVLTRVDKERLSDNNTFDGAQDKGQFLLQQKA